VLGDVYAAITSPELRASFSLWFFVPFSDPEPHLRLRFRGDPRGLTERLLPELRRALSPLLESGVVFRLQLDSYEREIERYGGPEAMELSEQLFCADSEAAAELLQLLDDDDPLGWQLALLGIDRLFRDLGLDFDERASLIREAGDAYGSEFGATTATWRKVGDKYRKHATGIGQLLFERAPPDDPRLIEAVSIFERRSSRLAGVRDGLERLRARGELLVERGSLLRSYAHMHAIRVLGDGARYYELVLYDFLRRQYAAHAARTGRAVPGKGNRGSSA
jgi:thiopeptide-type bacteriocin biosynthesis protein